jgi:threonine synthase
LSVDLTYYSPDSTRNRSLRGLACIRCDFTSFSLDFPNGCPACADHGHAANLRCLYDTVPGNADLPLPYLETPHLGEGATPLVVLPAALAAPERACFFKMECANPTGSHKDRMAAMGVAHAKAIGKRCIIAASSGNAGVAVAAYAAAANIPCEIAITPACNTLYRALMTQHGAIVTECADSLARWAYVAVRCKEEGVYSLTNYALPAVGSPAIAIEGYKPIAIELINDLKAKQVVQIEEIYVPVARGDLLWGLYLGFKHALDCGTIARLPKLVAVEPYARLAKVIAGSDYRKQYPGTTLQLSTAGSTVTFQALQAVQRSRGRVEVVADDEAMAARDTLARAGWSFELCTAAAYAAYRRSDCAALPKTSAAIVIATAHGSRDALDT